MLREQEGSKGLWAFGSKNGGEKMREGVWPRLKGEREYAENSRV